MPYNPNLNRKIARANQTIMHMENQLGANHGAVVFAKKQIAQFGEETRFPLTNKDTSKKEEQKLTLAVNGLLNSSYRNKKTRNAMLKKRAKTLEEQVFKDFFNDKSATGGKNPTKRDRNRLVNKMLKLFDTEQYQKILEMNTGQSDNVNDVFAKNIYNSNYSFEEIEKRMNNYLYNSDNMNIDDIFS